MCYKCSEMFFMLTVLPFGFDPSLHLLGSPFACRCIYPSVLLNRFVITLPSSNHSLITCWFVVRYTEGMHSFALKYTCMLMAAIKENQYIYDILYRPNSQSQNNWSLRWNNYHKMIGHLWQHSHVASHGPWENRYNLCMWNGGSIV